MDFYMEITILPEKFFKKTVWPLSKSIEIQLWDILFAFYQFYRTFTILLVPTDFSRAIFLLNAAIQPNIRGTEVPPLMEWSS